MFDSDQIFVVCVEPPTQSSEGQLHQINTYHFQRGENDDKWVRGIDKQWPVVSLFSLTHTDAGAV